MRLRKGCILFCIAVYIPHIAKTQYASTFFSDSLAKHSGWKTDEPHGWKKIESSYKQFIIPAIFIAYGFTALHSDPLADLNEEIKEEWWTESKHKTTKLDNYLQFSPFVAVYGLNLLGIPGKNNFLDQTMILAISSLLMGSSVYVIKNITHIERPDGSSFTSFPSGHAATAFEGAAFLSAEYKDVSVWYSIAGYGAATATAYLRLYNNKHWLNDVVAGAGIGILSTKIAYAIYPMVKCWLFKNKSPATVVLPAYQDGSFGFSMIRVF